MALKRRQASRGRPKRGYVALPTAGEEELDSVLIWGMTAQRGVCGVGHGGTCIRLKFSTKAIGKS